MATVQLSDVYNPLVFAKLEQEKQIELNAFLNSGVMSIDGRVNDLASVGGDTGELPFYVPLTIDEPNYSNDNPAASSTPAKISNAKQRYRLASVNKSWAAMDLSRELALADPVDAITTRIAQYFATNTERRVIESVRGLLKDNIANDSSDMIFDISAIVDTAATDANLVDRDAIIDARQTMGDHRTVLGVMAAHSKVISRLEKIDALNFTREKLSDTDIEIKYYAGMRVVEDDSLSGITYGTTPANTYYDTILFGMDAFGYGNGRVLNPSEIDRDPASGNGGGQTIIYSRKAEIIHPYGFDFTSSSVAGQSATYAELATAANWNRVYVNRKNVNIAVLRSNG